MTQGKAGQGKTGKGSAREKAPKPSSEKKGEAVGKTAKKKPAAKKTATKKATGRAKKENRPRSIPPHPRYPDVEKLPYKWQPGSRGRPPSGWGKDAKGDPVPGKGWRKIAGKWHKPMDSKVAKPAAKKSAAKKPPAKKKPAAKKKAPAKKGSKRRK